MWSNEKDVTAIPHAVLGPECSMVCLDFTLWGQIKLFEFELTLFVSSLVQHTDLECSMTQLF